MYQQVNEAYDIDASKPLMFRDDLIHAPMKRTKTLRYVGIFVFLLVTIPLIFSHVSQRLTTGPFTRSEQLSETEKFSLKTEEEKQALFEEFQSTYEINYSNDEEKLKKYEIFKLNLEKIDELNSQRSNDEAANFHISKFADLTQEEFYSLSGVSGATNFKQEFAELTSEEKAELGYIPFEKTPLFDMMSEGDESLEAKLDSNAAYNAPMNPVQNMLTCNAAWAFAAVANMESVYQNSNAGGAGQLLKLSEQELIDCAPNNQGGAPAGCNYGNAYYGFNFVIKNNGVELETQYPYSASANAVCHSAGTQAVTINGWSTPRNTADNLQQLIRVKGAFATSIDPSQLQFYKSGTLSCSSNDNYEVFPIVVSGYTQQYWILRNAWGTNWGVNGLVNVAIGSNDCGVGDNAMTAFI